MKKSEDKSAKPFFKMGRWKNPTICDDKNILAVSNALQKSIPNAKFAV